MKRSSGKFVAGIALLVSVGACSGAPVPRDGVTVGDDQLTRIPATDRSAPLQLRGPSLDGQPLDLAGMRGHVVVVNVWYAGCGPCRAEAPTLADVARTSSAAGVEFVGVNTSYDNTAEAKAYEKSFAITYPSFDDSDNKLESILRAKAKFRASPTTLVLDKQGRVAARINGPVHALGLKQLITATVAE